MIYSHDNILDFKDIHKGKRAIVCGAGPSLNDINFDLISPEDNVIFACNQSVTALTRCDYFCLADNAIVVMPFFEYGIDITTRKVIAMGNLTNMLNNCQNKTRQDKLAKMLKGKVHVLPRGFGDSVQFKKWGPIIRGPDGKNGLHEDVVHLTSHFAHITGCREIVLAGVDLTVDNGIYCKPTTYKEEVDWSKVALVNEKSVLDASFKTWVKVKRRNRNIKFLDASPRGVLNKIFNSIPVEDLYKN